MFKKVIVGDDGLDGGRDALALAQAIAPEAEVIIATAYPWDATPSRFAQLGYANILRDDTLKALQERREEAGLTDARLFAMPDTSPARALHRLAEQEHADLLVVGSARHGAVGRLLLGDVSRDVLHGSPCPVAVAPLDRAVGRPARIGIAFDHSPEAERALALGVALAEGLMADVDIREVVAADLLPAIGGYPIAGIDEIERELISDAQARLDAVVAGLGTSVAVHAQAVGGSVSDRMAELAGEVDLLVCGSRGWGAVRRVVLGSTADHLIHHAGCPVMVVPRTADVEPAAPPADVEAATA
jgi:nucleotide-binding universal stress UspA family protein